MTYFLRFFLVFFVCFIGGCKSMSNHGNYIDDDVLSKINKENPSKDKLVELIGSPTYTPREGGNVWYYIQRVQSQRLWFKPKVQEQRVVKVIFDKNKVKLAELMHNLHDESISVVGSGTNPIGAKSGSAKKFFKNLGRFNKGKSRVTNRAKKK